MRITQLAVFLLSLTLSHFSLASSSERLTGTWTCGPYNLQDGDMKATVTDIQSYNPDGTYSELSKGTSKFPDGYSLTIESKLSGKWSFDGNIIHLIFEKEELLSVDDPNIDIQKAQQGMNEHLKEKNWSKYKVIELGEKLIFKPIETEFEAARITITCQKNDE